MPSDFRDATSDLPEDIDGDYGWPIIGTTLDFLKDPGEWWRQSLDNQRRTFKTYAFGEYAVLTCRADFAQEMLVDRQKRFSSWYGWQAFLGTHFPRGLMLRDFEEHRHHRNIMQHAFSKTAMRSYMGALNPALGEGVDGFAVGEWFPFFPAVKSVILAGATRVFMGADETDQQALNDAFVDSMACVDAVIRVPLPGTNWRRANSGRERLVGFFGAAVARRRADPGDDMISLLAQAKGEDGSTLSDDEIVDHMIFMMMAAHDTSTSALGNMAYELARNPDWQDKLRTEVQAIDKPAPEYSDLALMPLTSLVFKEVLRLYPPVPSIPRRTTVDCEVDGIKLKANTQVWFNAYSLHRDPSLWTQPGVFDPERFNDERQEHKGHRYQYIPFSGGAHTCIGMAFGEMTVKSFVHQLLSKYRLELKPDFVEQMVYFPFPKPASVVPIRLVPLTGAS